jgi:hypothetical protein
MPTEDIADTLRAIGVRVSREALLALTAHATTARFSPLQTFEDLAALARRERDSTQPRRTHDGRHAWRSQVSRPPRFHAS